MEEPQIIRADSARQAFDSLSVVSETSVVTSVERQLEERLLRIHEVESGHSQVLPERLLIWIDGRRYSVALSSLREALPAIPRVTSLPFSPTWLVGLFPLRTELVTLVDLHPIFDAKVGESVNAQPAQMRGEQALLIGDTGRLLAFGVDRIGDIINASNPVSPHHDDELAQTGATMREVERITPPHEEGQVEVVTLDLTDFYEDVISKLEEWARNA